MKKIFRNIKNWRFTILSIDLGLIILITVLGILKFNLPNILILIINVIISILSLIIFVVFIDFLDRISRVEMEKSQTNGILESMGDGVISYTQKFEIISINESLEHICGIKKSELLGKTITPEWDNNPKLSLLTKIVFPTLSPTIYRMTNTDYPSKVVLKLEHPEEKILEIITNRIINKFSNSVIFIKIVKDRTREEQLLKLKSDFITVAAHQLRTPITGVAWSFDMLKNETTGPLNEKQKEIINLSTDAIEEMKKTIEDLLEAAKIEEGKSEYNFKPTQLESLFDEVIGLYGPKCMEKNIKILIAKPNPPLSLISIDKDKLKVALQNLIDNGVKYNVQNGEVRINIQKLTNQPYIQIDVQDTGMGIPEKDLPNMFAKFFRAENVVRQETRGTGLGLHIVKNIIENHGGKIWVESIEKRGTTFHFTIPTDPSLIPPQYQRPLNIL